MHFKSRRFYFLLIVSYSYIVARLLIVGLRLRFEDV
nr:MAG TPA: hypothetical protein [Caudoviricetes sp.]